MTTQQVLISIALMALAVSATAKSGSTIYTPTRVANVRRNIARYDWAKRMRDDAVANADAYMNQPDDWLWSLPTPQSIPRGIHVCVPMGCPKCGHAIDKFGNYPWKVDVVGNPWKITCPNCGEVYPKNDFAKFYESGKDANGVFHYDKADRSLLFNTDHPDPKDPLHSYCVDDTMGWKDDKGNTFRFIGYYGHYGAWTATRRALGCLRDAYLYTGDLKYARKTALLLYRIAKLYPDMDYNYWAKLGFTNSDGGSNMGKIYGRIWETDLAKTFCETYDAIFPALNDSQLLADLSKRTGGTVTAANLQKLYEDNLLHQVHDGIINRTIEGNEGMYQSTMAVAAIALDEPGTTEKWLDWIFTDGDMRHTGKGGGNMGSIFKNKVDDDGMGDEASPGYNSIWRGLFSALNDTLLDYPSYKGNKIEGNPKLKKMFEAPARLTLLGRFSPHIGDTGSTGSAGLAGIGAFDMAFAYNKWKDPEFAQMAWFLNGGKADGLRLSPWEAEPEEIAKQIEAVVKEHGPWIPKTDNMPSYGLAMLRSGTGDNARALSLYYGRNTGHGHKDTLNIELFAFGLSLMPDLGYPEYASSDCASRYEWTENTISHNTVIVDQKPQENQVVGTSHFVTEGKGVSAAEISADKPYPQTSLYQRTTALVDISDKDSYIVDIFRVKGGNEHIYSLHGAEGEVETEGLNLIDQPKGTLAGENVEPYADLGFLNHTSNMSGYQYLYDIRRDAHPSAQPSITYRVVDTWHLLKEPKDVRLRVNLLSPPGEVILAHGDPPRNKPGNPKNLRYILLPHKTGGATAPASGSGAVAPRTGDSTFVSVLEPYVGARTISKIERRDDGDMVTITVTTASGRVDTIVSALKPIKTRIAGTEVPGRFAVVSEENGKAETRLVVQ